MPRLHDPLRHWSLDSGRKEDAQETPADAERGSLRHRPKRRIQYEPMSLHCTQCDRNTDCGICPRCASNLAPEPARPDKAVFASTDWVGALATRWERRLAESSGTTRDALDCGRILQLRECCDELRAEMESAPTDEAHPLTGDKTQ